MVADLLLVGAGHAHLHLLVHAARLRDAGYRLTLVAPRWFDYSGAASAAAVGALARDDARIDVAELARRHGVTHHLGTVVELDPLARTALCDDGTSLTWGVASLNIGSVSDLAATARPAAPDRILAVKPLQDLHRLRDLLDAGRGRRVTVVGAGASGLELAAQLALHPGVERVRLLEIGPRIGAHLPPRAADRAARVLARRGVEVVTGSPRALDVAADDDITLLATGLRPAPLATRAPLGGPDGVPVRATLQHRDHDDLYAAGDCADFLPRRLPRVGVHGVRQGPVLLDALLARAEGSPAPRYRPQRAALAVLDLGGVGLAVRGRWWWLGRTPLRLKRTIDRRWLRRYRV